MKIYTNLIKGKQAYVSTSVNTSKSYVLFDLIQNNLTIVGIYLFYIF